MDCSSTRRSICPPSSALPGQIDRQGFLEALNDDGKVLPVFERRLKYGQLLTNVTSER